MCRLAAECRCIWSRRRASNAVRTRMDGPGRLPFYEPESLGTHVDESRTPLFREVISRAPWGNRIAGALSNAQRVADVRSLYGQPSDVARLGGTHDGLGASLSPLPNGTVAHLFAGVRRSTGIGILASRNGA